MPLDIKLRSNQPFEIKNKSATKAEIIIYGSIGDGWFEDSISAKQFSDELNKLEKSVNEITVRINSPGGDVFQGIAIYNRLKQHSAKIIVYIDGLAASIASIIALAGDEIIMGEGALYMIHLPWTMAAGDRNSLENTIQLLSDIEEQLISIYISKCGKKTKKTRAEVRKMLEDETWLDAAQTVEMGFADRSMTEKVSIAAKALESKWFHKAPSKVETVETKIRNEIDMLQNKIDKVLTRK